MELVKEKELVKEDNLDEVAGGFATVSDPIYSLTENEVKVLKKAGYRLDRTNSGNYRVKYPNGTTIEPHVLGNMCNIIALAQKKDTGNGGWKLVFDF